MFRREFLTMTASVPLIGILASCAGKSPSSTLAQVITDVGTIAAGLAGVLPSLAKVTGISQETINNINVWIADLQKAGTAIVSATTVAAAQPIVQQVETDVNAIVAALSGLPLPSAIETVVLAASILLPVIETAVGLALPPSAPTARMAASSTMSVDQARLVLRASASR